MTEAHSLNMVNETLSHWRQGDCVLGAQWFCFRLDPDAPLTDEAKQAASEGYNLGEAEVFGLMVATQTCDIVRDCKHQPFVEACPLVEVSEEIMNEIELRRRPGYAYIPGVASHRLVADLNRTMTLEKSAIAKWTRLPGCVDDKSVRDLAQALSRKRSRFAFPDDFVAIVDKLRRHILRRHEKDSDAGRALRALREIRVRASPDWSAETIELHFWFIRNQDEVELTEGKWEENLESWDELIERSEKFNSIFITSATLKDLTANDYVESDLLDFDHLSS